MDESEQYADVSSSPDKRRDEKLTNTPIIPIIPKQATDDKLIRHKKLVLYNTTEPVRM